MGSAQDGVHLVAATVGFASFYLLWFAAMCGVFLRNGWALTRIRHATIYGLHQMVASLGLCLAVVHAFAQLAVPNGSVRLVDEFVPFVNRVDPTGVGLGVVGLELLVAAALSVLVQRRLGYGRWRALHAMTYAAFLLLAAHVLFAGSESGRPWVWGPVLVSVLALVLAWSSSTAWAAVARRRVRSSASGEHYDQQSTVNVDSRRCVRFGFCEQAAPDVFKLRSDGRLAYRATVSDDEVDPVIRAVEACPARAIALSRAPTSVMTPPPEPDDDPEPRAPRLATVTGLHHLRSVR
jgi:sulfoxide reductase heme-binding subunit YedZ